MGSISAGTITARLGADTSDFQAKLKESGGLINDFAGRQTQFGEVSERGFLRATRGLDMFTASLQGGSGSMARSLEVMLHFGGAMQGALVVGAATAGWEIGKLISNVTGLSAETSKAAPLQQQLADTIANNADRYEQARQQAIHLADSLGLEKPLILDVTQASADGAKKILEWTDATIKAAKESTAWKAGSVELTNEITKLTAKLDEANREGTKAGIQQLVQVDTLNKQIKAEQDHNTALVKTAELVAKYNASGYEQLSLHDKMKLSLDQMTAKEETFGESVIKTYGIITQEGAVKSLSDMEDKIHAVALAGGDASSVMDKMGPDIVKAVDAARKMGVDVPTNVEDMYDAIKAQDAGWFEYTYGHFKQMPEIASRAAEDTKAKLGGIGDGVGDGIAKGIKKGADDGGASIVAAVNQAKATVEATPLRLNVDQAYILKQIQDAIAAADFRGAVPG